MNEGNIFKKKKSSVLLWTAIIITIVLVGLFITGIVLNHDFRLIVTGIIPLAVLLVNRFQFVRNKDFNTITVNHNEIILTSKNRNKLITKSFSADFDIKKIHISNNSVLIDLNDETFFTLNANDFKKTDRQTIIKMLNENYGDKINHTEKKDNKIIFMKSMAIKISLIGVFFTIMFLGINAAFSVALKQITLLAITNLLIQIYLIIVLILSAIFNYFVIVGQENLYYISNNNSTVPTKYKSFQNLEEINYMYQKTKSGKKALPVMEFKYSDAEPCYIETCISKKEFNILLEAIKSHVSVKANNYVEEVTTKLKSEPDRKKSIICNIFFGLTFIVLIPIFIINAKIDENSPYLPAATISMFTMFAAFFIMFFLTIKYRNKVEKLKQNSDHVHIQEVDNNHSSQFTELQLKASEHSDCHTEINQITLADGFGGKLTGFEQDSVSEGILYYKEITQNNFDVFYLPTRTNSFLHDSEQFAVEIDCTTVYNYMNKKFKNINITCAVIFNYRTLSENEKIFFANSTVKQIHYGDNIARVSLCGICKNTIYFNKNFDEIINRTFVKK